MVVKHSLCITGILFAVMLFCVTAVMADPGEANGASAPAATSYSPGELDELLAPIALYSDPLLAQVLPAATFPDQLAQAAQLVADGRSYDIDRQDWDISVKAVAHYPTVLRKMADQPEWTDALGQAYYYQPADVMNAIQRLRGKARLMGYLHSNNQQSVIVNDGEISIVPANPRYIFVPTYDPQVVYVHRYEGHGPSVAIAFGLGLLIGAWLNSDCDWHHHRVYYHGWDEHHGGWISRCRPHVEVHNTYYVNKVYVNRPIIVNRHYTPHTTVVYRQHLRQNVGHYKLPESHRPVTTHVNGTIHHISQPATPRVNGTIHHISQPAAPRVNGTIHHISQPSVTHVNGTVHNISRPSTTHVNGTLYHTSHPSVTHVNGTVHGISHPSVPHVNGTFHTTSHPSTTHVNGSIHTNTHPSVTGHVAPRTNGGWGAGHSTGSTHGTTHATGSWGSGHSTSHHSSSHEAKDKDSEKKHNKK